MPNEVTTQRLIACGVIGPPLFVIAFLVEGATRANYDSMRTFVSLLELTDQGWTQIANFLITGLLFLAFAVGLRRALVSGTGRRWGPIMVGAVGLGLVLAGLFVTDPGQGYPPGTPPGLSTSNTSHGSVHFLGALLVFTGLPAACFILARRFRRAGDGGWAAYSVASGVGMLVFFVASFMSPGTAGAFPDITGLLQRISIVIGWAWIAVLAASLLQERRSAARS